MLIDITTGNEIFKDVSAKTYTFFVPTTKYPGTERHIGTLAAIKNKENNPHGVTRLAKPVVTNAHVRLDGAMGGLWSAGVIDIPEDMVLKIFMQKSVPYGQMRVAANMLIRIRKNAAHRRISVLTHMHADATNKHVYIEGRFDILTPDEARQLGAVLPKQMDYLYDDARVGKGFNTAIIYPALSNAPTVVTNVVENSKGEEVEIKLTRKPRIIKL